MARKTISQKTRRKDELDPTKDEFVTRSISYLDWAVERRRHIGVLLGVALVAAIAAIVVNRVIDTREADATALIGDALEAALAPIIPPTDELAPEVEEGEEEVLVYESTGARATESLKRFGVAIEDQGSSAIGLMALLGSAAAHLDLGEIDQAIEQYQRFLDDATSSDTAFLRPNALEGLGHALEEAGKLDDARARFKELADQSDGRTRLVARYDEARILERQGDKTAAAKILKEVIDEIIEGGEYDRLDYLFIEGGERLRSLDPEADVPSLPGGGFGGLDGIDPAMLEQLMRAKQEAEGGAP